VPLRTATLDELVVDDEASFAHVALYDRLKRVLKEAGYRFRLPAPGARGNWDRALFLNLTFWNGEEGADVLSDDHIPADVIAHVALHHVVSRRLAGEGGAGARSAAALLFGESIASAFDLYLVGRLLPNVPEAEFVTSQLPIMSEAAEQAGLPAEEFASMIDEVVQSPERAFEDMRELLFDVATALLGCGDVLAADAVLERFAGHRFAPLLHHYQLSNWILHARAHGRAGGEERVQAADASLRAAPVALDWLADNWLG
jgi:hypothetical protein